MPPFLDTLVGEVAEAISGLSRNRPAVCLAEARKSRLSHEMLALVGRGGKLDPAGWSRTWKGAVSAAFLAQTDAALRVAYSQAALPRCGAPGSGWPRP